MSKDLTVVQTGWLEKWEKAEIPWHKPKVDNNIQRHLEELTRGQPSASILVTWCGKSVDMPWLCSQGYNVVGVELSTVAVRQFFEENEIPYSTLMTQANGEEFVVYRAQDRKLTIFLGDYYKLTPDLAGTFEAIWDNNAFGSSPPADRLQYISVLASLLKANGRVLLANWEYGELIRDTYPYSLSSSLVKEFFQEKFEIKYLGKCEIFTDYFIKKFNVDFAYRNIHLLSKKSV